MNLKKGDECGHSSASIFEINSIQINNLMNPRNKNQTLVFLPRYPRYRRKMKKQLRERSDSQSINLCERSRFFGNCFTNNKLFLSHLSLFTPFTLFLKFFILHSFGGFNRTINDKKFLSKQNAKVSFVFGN